MTTQTSVNVCKLLSKAGLKLNPYKRSPFSGLNFTMAVGSGGKEIRLYSNDTAELTIHGHSKKFNQVALSVKEKTRRFTDFTARACRGYS